MIADAGKGSSSPVRHSRGQEQLRQGGVTTAHRLDHCPVRVQRVAGLLLQDAPRAVRRRSAPSQQFWFQVTETRHEIELIHGIGHGDHHLHAVVHQVLDVRCQPGFCAEHSVVIDADLGDTQFRDASGP